MRGLVAAIALFALVGTGDGAAVLQSSPDQITMIEDLPWAERARLAMDHDHLSEALEPLGYRPSGGVEIYLMEVVPGVGQPAYLMHDAGDGAFSIKFWPASSVKLMVTVAALSALADLGFTGDAVVRLGHGEPTSVASIYWNALVRSSNVAYDQLIQITGLDYLNQTFIPDEGLDSMIIGSTLSGLSVEWPPPYTLTEGGRLGWLRSVLPEWIGQPAELRQADVPARSAQHRYRDNDTNLFDLVEVLRRVALQNELPPGEGFGLGTADLRRVNAALCAAEPKNFEAGAQLALGPEITVCNKAGWSRGRCTDVALIIDTATGRRFFLGAAARCGSQIRIIGQAVMTAAVGLTGTPLQPDDGLPIEVALELEDGHVVATVDMDADSGLVWVDSGNPVMLQRDRDHLSADLGQITEGRHILVVQGTSSGANVGYRSVGFEVRTAPTD